MTDTESQDSRGDGQSYVSAQPPLVDYLRMRESHEWTPADTALVMEHVRQVERLALELIQRARKNWRREQE